MKLDFEHNRVIIDPRVTKFRLLAVSCKPLAVGFTLRLAHPVRQTDRQTDRQNLTLTS